MTVGELRRPTPAELLRKTRRIEIRTSRLVNELFGGRYHSTFKGRGVEFTDVREYVPGDDVRAIHWNITAKLGHPYVKRFTEERELSFLIAVDLSASHDFGTHQRNKSELTAELAALLSFAALKNNDKIGLLLFTDRVESYLPPRKTRSHVLRIIRDVLGFSPQGRGTDIEGALSYLNRVHRRRSIVFLISDFIDESYEHTLRVTQRRHDTVALAIEDPMERRWPAVGRMLIEDPETGERALSGGTALFRTGVERTLRKLHEDRDVAFARSRLDRVVFRTNQDYVRPLLQFFQERAKRFR